MNSASSSQTLPEILRPYNRAEIARRVGVPRSRVNRWAAGESFPEVQHLQRLAEVLRIDVSDLATIIAASAEIAAAS